ncbi:unnamed protein product [Microthlaspi erraticum]|uniref:Small ribosomal subunit protein uS7 domain-containing protein n=1 Tax=Microthlaspi erraticum TaxID=1685480 RepID=A0A6D2JLP0_9BRAS|nr:unnamed protein product [Microthlaspi erraticum]CAA7049969.1 unnamed protein product [Microthlaspi erraticum]
MMNGRNNCKMLMAVGIIKHAMEIIHITPQPPLPVSHPRPLSRPAGPSRPVGITPVRRPVRYFREALMICLLSLQSTPDLSTCFGLTHTVSETTSRKVTHPSTTPAQARLTGVTYRPLTEKVIIDDIVNSGPREDATSIGSAGVVRRQAVDISPLRRVNQAIFVLTTGAREAAFRNIKTISECLADELINALKGSSNSYAMKKKDEIEKIAKANR